jgi:diphthamide synthase (EF-2-diphthine--ammonia ligase)
MGNGYTRVLAQGVRQVVFGDLFLEDSRAYRIETLACRQNVIFPLWKRDTHVVAREIVLNGDGRPPALHLGDRHTAGSLPVILTKRGAKLPSGSTTERLARDPVAVARDAREEDYADPQD